MTTALSSDAVAAIDDLELAARLVVEGLRAGAHPSPLRGFSAEFQQHRPYQIGDDLKYLDWKLLARTDRLYSKQFRETTSMSVMIVLDASASMAFPDGITKFRYASIAVAALAHLIITQGDAAGLMTMSGGSLSYMPSRGGRLHLRSLVAHIDRLEPRGTWDPARAIARGAELLKRRGVVLVVSDFYDAEDATRAALRLVARRGHDVAMLQVISPAERALPDDGDLELEDLESGERRLIDSSGSAQHYSETVAAFLARCRAFAEGEGIDYALLSTDSPPERALREYLLRRSARVHSVHTARQKLK